MFLTGQQNIIQKNISHSALKNIDIANKLLIYSQKRRIRPLKMKFNSRKKYFVAYQLSSVNIARG